MHPNLIATVGLVALLAGCQNGAGAPGDRTGLQGVIRRGPVTPVCRPDIPCDAPFAGQFLVSKGNRVVAEFTSDSAGRFQVALAPGDYLIAPTPGAPVMPGQQESVSVPDSGVAVVALDFDTGIR
jgi:hypothetical protein